MSHPTDETDRTGTSGDSGLVWQATCPVPFPCRVHCKRGRSEPSMPFNPQTMEEASQHVPAGIPVRPLTSHCKCSMTTASSISDLTAQNPEPPRPAPLPSARALHSLPHLTGDITQTHIHHTCTFLSCSPSISLITPIKSMPFAPEERQENIHILSSSHPLHHPQPSPPINGNFLHHFISIYYS